MNARLITHLILSISLAGQLAAEEPADTAKAIGKVYAAVEAKLKESTHYEWKVSHVEEEFTHQCEAWMNREGQAMKVTDDLTKLESRRLTEYVFDGGKLVFVLRRQEDRKEDDATAVQEDRLYFAGDRLIYHLAKESKFKSGAALDMSKAKNAPRDVEENEYFAEHTAEARQIVKSLETGPLQEAGAAPEAEAPAAAESSAIPPVSERELPAGAAEKHCTVIEESASPDGRYALAWGIFDPANKTDGPAGSAVAAEEADQETDGVTNYIVDTKAGRIIAITSGLHFGSKASYNHWTHSALWSPDSSMVIQMTDMKWATASCEAFHIAGGKATRMTDVLDDVRAAVEAKLDKTGEKEWKASRDSYSLSLSALALAKDGSLTLDTYHQVPKGEETVFHFKVTGSFDDTGKFKPAKIVQVKD